MKNLIKIWSGRVPGGFWEGPERVPGESRDGLGGIQDHVRQKYATVFNSPAPFWPKSTPKKPPRGPQEAPSWRPK